jgi:hypothetical protein
MRAAAAAFAILLAAAAPLAAAAQVAPPRWNPRAPENSEVLPTFNYQTVEAVLTQIGARFERRGTPDRPALSVTFPNNRRAAILFGSCERQGAACRALSVQATWSRPAAASPERLAQALQGFNQRYAFSRAFLTADNRPALQRYLTADYGFIRGDLALNLLVFANQSERFAAEVIAPLER